MFLSLIKKRPQQYIKFYICYKSTCIWDRRQQRTMYAIKTLLEEFWGNSTCRRNQSADGGLQWIVFNRISPFLYKWYSLHNLKQRHTYKNVKKILTNNLKGVFNVTALAFIIAYKSYFYGSKIIYSSKIIIFALYSFELLDTL
jgi:hypothetical protein